MGNYLSLFQPAMLHPISILPHTNLPQNLPLVLHEPPQNFSIKDPHLLKPPQVLGAGRKIMHSTKQIVLYIF